MLRYVFTTRFNMPNNQPFHVPSVRVAAVKMVVIAAEGAKASQARALCTDAQLGEDPGR